MLFVNLNSKIHGHQAALADAMYSILGDNFYFIEFGSNSRQYGSFSGSSKGVDYYKDRPYILKMFESEANTEKAKELIAKADAVRTGGEPFELVRDRIKEGKLTFRSTERFFKGPLWRDVFRTRALYHFLKYSNPNYRILCLSAYMANDLSLLGKRYIDKCYKFAYFTTVPQIDVDKIINNRRKDKIQIIWCARFIDWKHPELPLKLAKRLIQSGRDNFEIQMVGANTTPLWHKISQQVQKDHLVNHITLTGGIPNLEVLERMRNSHIFIFTSDRGEGWGAVLNEAMGAGCACVASNEIGAVPFLLKNNKNGLIFKSCSDESLFERVAYLYDNPGVRDEYARKAYHTITTDWSAQLAAERLVSLSESILAGQEISFEEGPCSKAVPLKYKNMI